MQRQSHLTHNNSVKSIAVPDKGRAWRGGKSLLILGVEALHRVRVNQNAFCMMYIILTIYAYAYT